MVCSSSRSRRAISSGRICPRVEQSRACGLIEIVRRVLHEEIGLLRSAAPADAPRERGSQDHGAFARNDLGARHVPQPRRPVM